MSGKSDRMDFFPIIFLLPMFEEPTGGYGKGLYILDDFKQEATLGK